MSAGVGLIEFGVLMSLAFEFNVCCWMCCCLVGVSVCFVVWVLWGWVLFMCLLDFMIAVGFCFIVLLGFLLICFVFWDFWVFCVLDLGLLNFICLVIFGCCAYGLVWVLRYVLCCCLSFDGGWLEVLLRYFVNFDWTWELF